MKLLFKRGPFVALGLLLALSAFAADSTLDGELIKKLTGLNGAFNAQKTVFKVTQPRTDIKVSVDKWQMSPFMGLTSWVAFTKGKQADKMIMGDLVLFQDEVNPVMSAVLDNGLQVTALHNHFFYDDPKVYFMHVGGEGSTEALAEGVHKIFDRVKEVRSATPSLSSSFGGPTIATNSAITAKPIADILGSGEAKDGMYKVTIGLTTTMTCGCDVGKDMGVNTWAAFAGSDDNAVVDGDFAVHEGELQSVLKSLRASGINVVAIHHHMIEETPRILFLHYWGKGKAVDLARSVKAALDAQAETGRMAKHGKKVTLAQKN